MKKLIMLVGICLIAFAVKAQDDQKSKKSALQFAVVAGINLSGIHGESEMYSGSLLGGQIGVMMNVMELSEKLALRAELNFSMQGGKYEFSYGSYFSSGKDRLNYINLPIIARYKRSGGFFAEAGVQPGFLLSAKDNYEDDGESGSIDIKKYLNKFDLGIVLGAGFEFKNKIGVGIRVVPGLTNINKKDPDYQAIKDRNFVASLRASYSFY